MTVAELLEAMTVLYQGATPEALKIIKGAFYARLKKFEGDKLQAAFDEVVSTFKASTRQPFPMPGDFDPFLRDSVFSQPGGGPKLDIEGYRRRKSAIEAEWWAVQGDRISAERGAIIARACWFEVMARLSVEAWKEDAPNIRLSKQAIEAAEARAISSYRVGVYGASPLGTGGEEWNRQYQEIRSMLYAGETPIGNGQSERQALRPIHVKRPVRADDSIDFGGLDQ